MDVFIKAAAGVLVALIMCTMLAKQGGDITLLLTLSVCVLVLSIAVQQLEPIIRFFEKMQTIGDIDSNMVKILLKAMGIGLISEITSLLCSDSGNAAMGKTIQILASCVVLWISLPLFESLIELLEEILKFI